MYIELIRQFRYTDYAFREVLKATHPSVWVIDTYDINCQYPINVESRMDENSDTTPAQIKNKMIVYLIPKLHLMGHKVVWQIRFSCNYTPGVARRHGERIEGGWSVNNEAGINTQDMNKVGRHSALNDVFGYGNWEKLERLGLSSSRRACSY